MKNFDWEEFKAGRIKVHYKTESSAKECHLLECAVCWNEEYKEAGV